MSQSSLKIDEYHERMTQLLRMRYDKTIHAADFLQLQAMAAVEAGLVTYSKYINEIVAISGQGGKTPKTGTSERSLPNHGNNSPHIKPL